MCLFSWPNGNRSTSCESPTWPQGYTVTTASPRRSWETVPPDEEEQVMVSSEDMPPPRPAPPRPKKTSALAPKKKASANGARSQALRLPSLNFER